MKFLEVPGVGRVSRVGLGTWQFGSKEWGYGDAYASDRAHAIVRRALELGITFFDTAEVYGFGRSERILGAALGDDAERVVVATKVFPVLPTAPVVEQRAVASADRLGVRHLDLYACFPAPPQLAADALGVPVDDPERPLTCTGGLAFAGGPGNSYMTHAIANVVGRLREDPGGLGFASGVGWYATTHAAGVYGTRPPRDGFRRLDPQGVVDAGPRRAVAEGYAGPAELETYTVSHDRDGAPERAFLAVLTPDGARAWTTSTDPDLMAALETEELLGSIVTLAGDRFS